MGNVILIIIIIMLNGCSVRLLTIEVELKLRELLSMLSPCLTIVDNFLENKIKNIFLKRIQGSKFLILIKRVLLIGLSDDWLPKWRFVCVRQDKGNVCMLL